MPPIELELCNSTFTPIFIDFECQSRQVPTYRTIPRIHKVYFNDRHTTIEWVDGTKTTVGCSKDQKFDEYSGFAAAVLKRMFGTSKKAIDYMNEHKEVQLPSKKKLKKRGEVIAQNA